MMTSERYGPRYHLHAEGTEQAWRADHHVMNKDDQDGIRELEPGSCDTCANRDVASLEETRRLLSTRFTFLVDV